MTIEATIHRYILDNFLFTDNEDALHNDASFLEEGIVDSTGVLELVMFVEEAFGFQIADEDVVPDNFDSVAQLTRYVQRQLEAVSAHAGA
ncbi:MAG: acyl carrier protein [Anaerolineae bacterium]|nr:acyl carrier protein [Anaerolineae bacterium]